MSANAQEVLEELQKVGASAQELAVEDFTTHSNTVNERSLIAEFKAKRPLAIRQNVAYDLHLVAYESFSTDGTAGNTETFNLAHDLVDSKAVAEDLVLYEGGNKVQPDSVNYSGDSFDYTDDGTNNTLHVYYVPADQAHVEIEKRAPSNHFATLDELDAGLANLRDQARDPLSFEFGDPFAGVVPTDWRVEVYVDAPYTIQWEDDTDTGATASNALLTLPIRRAEQEIDGLADVVTARIDEV